ncbi:hypothetical protein [Roseiarcus sp.]|uniref:hypothetical protein n=1 Tax=Roseiarcus sp. TaxID=1969460 RepID=UPI003F9B6F30
MGQRFEWSSAGAIASLAAFLAVLIANGAQAGDAAPNPDLGSEARASPCGSAGESCAHISGYIKAGSDFSARGPDGLRPDRGAPPPSLFAGVGAASQGAAETSSRGSFFLPVSGDDDAR